MTATKLAVLYTVVHFLFVLKSIEPTRELCSGQFIHPNASFDLTEMDQLCIHHGYATGDLAGDGCRVQCRDFSWNDMAAIDRKKPLSCCMRGRNSVGVCLNGRCHSAGKSSQQARLSKYRRLKIKAVDLLLRLDECGPAQKLRLKIVYVKPDADRVGSYYNNETICISDIEKVRQIAKTYQLVKFNFTCKTLLVHKDSRIKFVAEDDSPIEERLTYEGEDKLSELRSESIDLKCQASSATNSLVFEVEILPSSG